MDSASHDRKIAPKNPLGAEIFAFKIWHLTINFTKLWGEPHPLVLYFSKAPMEAYNPWNFGFPTSRNVWDMWQNIQNLKFNPQFSKIGGTPNPKFYIFRKLPESTLISESLVFLSPEMSEICGKTFLAIVPNVSTEKQKTKKRSCVIVLDTPSHTAWSESWVCLSPTPKIRGQCPENAERTFDNKQFLPAR